MKKTGLTTLCIIFLSIIVFLPKANIYADEQPYDLGFNLTGLWIGYNYWNSITVYVKETVVDSDGTHYNEYEDEVPPPSVPEGWAVYVIQTGNELYGTDGSSVLTGTVTGNLVTFKIVTPGFTIDYEDGFIQYGEKVENFEAAIEPSLHPILKNMPLLIGTSAGYQLISSEHYHSDWDRYASENWTWSGDFTAASSVDGMKIYQLEALDNVPIRENVVYYYDYDPQTREVQLPIWDFWQRKERPIADDLLSEEFSIRVTIAAPNSLDWEPFAEYSWEIEETGQTGGGILNLRDMGGIPLLNLYVDPYQEDAAYWEGEFKVDTPDAVGKYVLVADVNLYNGDYQLADHLTTRHDLYVTYDKPLLPLPKEKWLEKATTWASGAMEKAEVASYLNLGIYDFSGWIYEDFHPAWNLLVEDIKNEANCWSFANVWVNLAKVLGIYAVDDVEGRTENRFGFLTIPNSALDGKSGNAHPPYGVLDKWFFFMHQVGKFEDIYYDPTFGQEYSSLRDFILCDGSGRGEDIFGRYYECGAYRVYYKGKLSESETIPEWEYRTGSAPAISPAGSGGGASFTNVYNDYAIDTDADGKYNNLIIEAEVDVTDSGTYSVFGILIFNTTYITARGDLYSEGVTSDYVSLEKDEITLRFSGNDIHEGGKSGNYSVLLMLADENGNQIDEVTYNISHYSYSAFGELPAEILDVSDYGEDRDGDGKYDSLVVEVAVNASRPMNCSIEGALMYANESLMVLDSKDLYVHEGTRMISLRLSGAEIHKSETDGPYMVRISLFEKEVRQIGYKEHTTQPYGYTDFRSEPCTMPREGLAIRQNTAFCPGAFEEIKWIGIDSNDIILDCNNALLNNATIALIGRSGVTIRNCNVFGILMTFAYDSMVFNNTVINFTYILFARNNRILGNSFVAGSEGMHMDYSRNNIISGNTVGVIGVANSDGNTISYNLVSGEFAGIYLIYSDGNILKSNHIWNSTGGAIGLSESHYNQVIGNRVLNNLAGIDLYESDYNKVMGNSVINNTEGGISLFSASNNTLAENRIVRNEDGMYVSGYSNNLTSNLVCVNWVDINYQDYGSGSNFGRENTCDVANYWNDEGRDGCTYDCSRDRDGDGVADFEDNCLFVYNPAQEDSDADGAGDACGCAGDVNGDDKVNIFDLASVGLAYGSEPEDSNWNAKADVTGDGKVNIFDLATVGLNYGKKC